MALRYSAHKRQVPTAVQSAAVDLIAPQHGWQRSERLNGLYCSNLQNFEVTFAGGEDAAALAQILSKLTGLTQLILRAVSAFEQPAALFAPALRKLSKLQILDVYELDAGVIRAIAHICTLTSLKSAVAEALVEAQQQQQLPVLPHVRVLTIYPDEDSPQWPAHLFPHLTNLVWQQAL